MLSVSAYDIVVFDMEDALVDRRSSECAAISRAIDSYLTVLLGVRPEGGPVFTPDEVKAFMESQGFDPDEELLNVLLSVALHTLTAEPSEAEFGVWDGREMLEAVRKSGQIQDSLGDLGRRKNVHELVKLLKQKGGGKRGFGRIRGLRNRWLALSEGHIMMDNLVNRILAEAYLGEELFHKEYGQNRQFMHDDGTIALERAWLEPQDMSYLRQRAGLATVTSRSQGEAQYVLQILGIGQYLDAVVGQGAGGMGMPDEAESAWIRTLGVGGGTAADYATRVGEAIERTRAQEGLESTVRVAYVGNCAVDSRGLPGLKDRYQLTPIGCVFGQDPKVLQVQKEKGAAVVAPDPRVLLKVLSERPRMRSDHGHGHGY
ncbi:MAG: hypothetical protein FJ087_02470 [Deltaproteobacteria bacterium]|nr:hypothetical protein [Deltaproteobacteria bacterium]